MRRLIFIISQVVTAFLLLMAVADVLKSRAYWDLEWVNGGLVTAVLHNTPAEAAGLQPEDWILEVNGVPPQDMPVLASSSQTGLLHLKVLRQGQVLYKSYWVTASPTYHNFSELTKPFVGLCFWGIGLLLLVFRPTHPVIPIFQTTTQVVSVMLAFITLRFTLPNGLFVSNMLETVIAALAVHNYATFPQALNPRMAKPLLRTMYGGMVLMVLAAFAAVYLTEDRSLRWWQFQTQEVFTDLGLLTALLVLIVPYTRLTSLDDIRRKRLLIFGLALGLAPLIFLYRLPAVFTDEPWVAYDWVYPFIAFIPCMYGLALLRGELGKIDRFLNRSLVFSLILGILVGAYFLMFIVLDGLPKLTPLKPVVSAAVAVLAAWAFPRVRDSVQHAVDRLLYGGWYDYRTVIEKTANRLNVVTDQQMMARELAEVLKQMRFEEGCFLYPVEGATFMVLHRYGLSNRIRQYFSELSSGSISAALESYGKPCLHRSLQSMILLGERQGTLEVLPESSVWVPLMSRGKLQGLLWLGKRTMEAPVEPEDLVILRTLADQFAATVETMILIERLKTKVAELAETKARLAEGREAERLHLARELHDGPLQTLYRAGHLVTQAASQPEKTALLTQIAGLQQQVADTLRNVCIQLRPPLLFEMGLAPSLRTYLDEVYGMEATQHIHWRILPGDKQLDEKTRLAVFRILQEALNNALKYAEAREIWVHFALDAEGFSFGVRDNGKGFAVPTQWLSLARTGHFGLMGLAERVEMIGGTLSLHSGLGEGTKLEVKVPLL